MAHGLSCSTTCGSSWTRARTHVPYIGRGILNHCATREARDFSILGFIYRFILFIYLFTYLFLAALGLRCGAQASHRGGFSHCGAQSLGARASVVVARRLSSCGAWA